ncbi:hypothetical protein ACWX0K_25355 (plasmid) [Nitrobacteraceae bacterium UC4446_H13]
MAQWLLRRSAVSTRLSRVTSDNMTPRRQPPAAPADADKGAAAGLAFRQWLDPVVLPHIHVEPSPLTVLVP